MLSGGLGLWLPVYYTDSTFARWPQLWHSVGMCPVSRYISRTYAGACTLSQYPMFLLTPLLFGLASPSSCARWRKDRITRSCASHTQACVTWSTKSPFFYPSCTSSFLILVEKSFSTTDLRSPTTKLIYWNTCVGTPDLSTLMMFADLLLLVSSLGTTCHCLLKSVDHLVSFKIYTCQMSLIKATGFSRLPHNEKDNGLRLWHLTWLFLALSPLFPVPSPPGLPHCRFFKTLVVATACSYFSFAKRDNIDLACWVFCNAHAITKVYRCLQMAWSWWAVITVVATPSQSALLMWLYVSNTRLWLLSHRASRGPLHTRHHADYILPILVSWLAVGVFPATALPRRFLSACAPGCSHAAMAVGTACHGGLEAPLSARQHTIATPAHTRITFSTEWALDTNWSHFPLQSRTHRLVSCKMSCVVLPWL